MLSESSTTCNCTQFLVNCLAIYMVYVDSELARYLDGKWKLNYIQCVDWWCLCSFCKAQFYLPQKKPEFCCDYFYSDS